MDSRRTFFYLSLEYTYLLSVMPAGAHNCSPAEFTGNIHSRPPAIHKFTLNSAGSGIIQVLRSQV